MSLIVDSLTKTYGEQYAVNDVSFEAKKGQVLGFLGPNGAGKSTTMKMICGYVAPTSGNISVCGHDVLTSPLQAKRHIGYLPEHNPLYTEMYVREYLLFVAGIYKLANAKERVAEVIDITGLNKEANKHIHALSKGYRQRVGIAQAIIHKPDILILDEPTSGLDMNQLVDIRKLIIDLGKENTVILSTHIMQEVEAMCDRVLILNNGKLIADDPIEKLTSRLQGQTIVEILLDQEIDIEILESIEGVKNVEKEGLRYRVTCDSSSDLRGDIFDAVVSSNGKIYEMTTDQINMERVFTELTKSDHA